MAQKYTDVQSAVPVLPEREIIGDKVYIRTNIRQKETVSTEGEIIDKVWVYDEMVYTTPEYIQLLEDTLANTTVMSDIMFVLTAEKGELDATTMAEHSSSFEVWRPGVSYEVGNIRRYNEILYKCVQAHTSQDDWTPDASESLWTSVADPTEEWPAWSQPVGAHDAYVTGDKVSHKDKHWISTADSNVWEPGVYGWNEVTE